MGGKFLVRLFACSPILYPRKIFSQWQKRIIYSLSALYIAYSISEIPFFSRNLKEILAISMICSNFALRKQNERSLFSQNFSLMVPLWFLYGSHLRAASPPALSRREGAGMRKTNNNTNDISQELEGQERKGN